MENGLHGMYVANNKQSSTLCLCVFVFFGSRDFHSYALVVGCCEVGRNQSDRLLKKTKSLFILPLLNFPLKVDGRRRAKKNLLALRDKMRLDVPDGKKNTVGRSGFRHAIP